MEVVARGEPELKDMAIETINSFETTKHIEKQIHNHLVANGMPYEYAAEEAEEMAYHLINDAMMEVEDESPWDAKSSNEGTEGRESEGDDLEQERMKFEKVD